MHDDNPLWYDHAEPDEEPGSFLKALAATFVGLVATASLVRRIYDLPDRLWLALVGTTR